MRRNLESITLSVLTRFTALVAVCLALSAPTVSAAPAVTQFKLANGLSVVVVPDHRTPVVTHMLWYRVGAADEVNGKSGIAHFLEHLLFKGTAKNPAGRFSQQLAAVGGQENAFTSYDYTGYFQRTSREHLGTLMEFEADRMTGLVLTDDVVASERNVILEERNQRIDNEPSARLGEQLQAAQYLNHPYHRPTIGWRHEMETLDREDALNFYRRYYQPDNAVLIVAGDVTADEVKALAEKTYGKIERRGAIGPRVRPQEPPQIAERRVTFADLRVTQPSLQRSYLVPSYTTAKDDEAEALDLLAYVLGGGSNSRLYRALVVEKRLATNTGAWFQGTSLDDTRFGVYATAAAGSSLERVESAIDAEIERLLDKGVTSEELERSKSRMIADYVYAQDNQSTLARQYGAALTTGSSVEAVLARPERLRAVTADQVREAARRYLDKRRSVTGYLIREGTPREEKKS
ncbi:MAG: insulinase family protein [Alphaproteobacteria bacterium]|nr:MAG: insulinase family protein [Alphaproteobacteria bacterium]